MALSIDGTNTGTTGTGTTASVTLTTANAGDIIIINIILEALSSAAGFPTISSVTVGGSAATLRNVVNYTSPAGVGGSLNTCATYWFFASGALTGTTITANYTHNPPGSADDIAIEVYGVTGFTGTAYQTNPWDRSAATALGWAVTNTTASDTQIISAANVSTINAACMLIASAFSGSNEGSGAQLYVKFTANTAAGAIGGTTATQITTGAQSTGGSNSAFVGSERRVVAATQSNISFAFDAAATIEGWVIMPDALTSGGAVAPTGQPVGSPMYWI